MAGSNLAFAMTDFELPDPDEEEVGFVDLTDDDVEMLEDDEGMHFDNFDMWFEEDPEPMPELSFAGIHARPVPHETLARPEASVPLVVHRAAIDGHPCDAVQAFLRRQLPADCGDEREEAATVLWARHELFLYISAGEDERDRSKLEEARKALSKSIPHSKPMLRAWRTALRMIAETP